MTMKWKSMLLATLIAIALTGQPAQVVAQAEDGGSEEVEGFGSSKFWDYALCGASIAFAAGTGGWVLAGITCGRAVTEHWSD
jgi:hypothetical protein